MAAIPRRTFVFSAVLLLTIIAAGPDARDLGGPHGSVHAAGVETFRAPAPLKLYAQDPSHPGLVDPIPAGGLNGYCVDVENEGNMAVADDPLGTPPVLDGFSVVDGVLLDTARFDAGTATTTDDVYCAIIASDPGVTAMALRWQFSDGETGDIVELPLEVVEVTLEGSDGFVGSPATVCTVGWDPEFLTGASSNAAPATPDPTDDVVAADWTPSAGALLGDPYRSAGEWCVNVDAGAETLDIDVAFSFDAVYNRGTDDDDTSQTASLPGPDGLIDIHAEPAYSELRHVLPSGQVYAAQVSPAQAVHSQHIACIIPSSANDTLDPDGVQFAGVPATSVSIFHDGGGIDLPGIVDGTICIRWTASLPGDQFLRVDFEKVDGAFPGPRSAGWDSNHDGNDDDDETGGPTNTSLVMNWATFDRTEITRADTFDPASVVTDTTINVPIQFNVADGTYTFAGNPVMPLYEWVLTADDAFLTGVELEARITSTCGNFLNEDDAEDVLGKTVRGRSNEGRFDRIDDAALPPEPYGDGPDDLLLTILNDGACNPSSTIEIEIDAWLAGGEVLDTETLTITFTPSTAGAIQVPRLAWAGQAVDITFGFSVASGSCVEAGSIVHFSSDGADVGSFLTHPSLISLDAGHLFGPLGDECSQTVRFRSSSVGHVTIHASLEGNPFVQSSFPIYFMAIEDVTATATPQLYVSEKGDVSAQVRGWFPGPNPSRREALNTADGRGLPAHRWVLPDDWDLLRGDADFAPAWPASAPMPPTNVTFFMAREATANVYPEGPSDGALGWFLLDGGESSINVNPRTSHPSVLGSEERPRIITDRTDTDGVATVDSFGDLNVAYTECSPNAPTGNPHCDIDDFVGATEYYAIADYPGVPGHYPPVRSNNAMTEWLWAGYKRVTVIDTATPTLKYVVAHLRDRDGFCDAIGYNNALGIEVSFQVDSGHGRIIEALSEPSFNSAERSRALATTFDLLDNHGNLTHADIARVAFFDDECQAWIRVSNSVQADTNVLVTFPATPAPPPAEVRITGLVCTGDESVTVTNVDDVPVSLAGFGLNSSSTDLYADPEHLQLDGLLQPGESATFPGGPDAEAKGWINGNEIFADGGGVPDGASLVWDGFEMSRADCDGTFRNREIPETLPASGEGEIVLDVIVPFANEIPLSFAEGWNLITVPGEGFLDALIADHEEDIEALYGWNALDGRWEYLFPSAPPFVSNLVAMETGRSYWVEVNRPFTVIYAP